VNRPTAFVLLWVACGLVSLCVDLATVSTASRRATFYCRDNSERMGLMLGFVVLACLGPFMMVYMLVHAYSRARRR
jgi:uncharacterized membrane protein